MWKRLQRSAWYLGRSQRDSEGQDFSVVAARKSAASIFADASVASNDLLTAEAVFPVETVFTSMLGVIGWPSTTGVVVVLSAGGVAESGNRPPSAPMLSTSS